MKRYCLLLFCAIIAFSSCSGPESYLRKAVKLMDKHALYSESEEWAQARKKALEADPQTIDEAQDIISEALKVAGGKHSFLYKAEKVQDNETKEWEMPIVVIDSSNFAIVTLPDFMGNNEQALNYANTVIDAISDNINGVIIDLRGNTGGNMYPMISAVHRFITDGNHMLGFKSNKRTTWIPLQMVTMTTGVETKSHIDCPVAILTDGQTASSAEALLLCFRGQDNTKTFGAPTAGYASANSPYTLPDGSKLIITTSCDVARTGEVFCDDPIFPDQETKTPVEDAIEWIKSVAQL